MNYNIIKLISNGFNNSVYLIKNNQDKIKYILKVCPIINDKIDYKNEIWKEYDISLFISKLPNNKKCFLMSYYSHSIDKCNNISNNKYKYFDVKSNKIKSIKTNKCLYLFLDYKGNNLSKLIISNLIKTKKEKYNMIIQVLYALNILNKSGYCHNDIHADNISYIISNKPIKIGYKLLNSKYQYSLIDYGNSKHSKYKEKKSYIYEYLKINWDVLYFIREVILQHTLLNLENKPQINPSFKMENIKLIKNKYSNIWNKIKNTLCKKGNEYINWFQIFEKNEIHKFYINFNQEYPQLKLYGKNIINLSIINEIEILFSAYNRNKYLKMNMWKYNIPNLIPCKDIEYMILNLKDTNKIINYFYSKI